MPTITTADVSKARVQLDRMRSSLASWLHYRTLNDKVATGLVPSKFPVAYAKKVMLEERDWATEQKLAARLHVLLTEVLPGAVLPTPSIDTNPNAAVQLAQIAITGEAALAAPTTQGFIPPTMIWPLAIVAGLLLAVTTVVTSMADVAKEKERLKCVQSGACTDYGFWLKAGGIAMLAYVAWTYLGPSVRARLPRGR